MQKRKASSFASIIYNENSICCSSVTSTSASTTNKLTILLLPGEIWKMIFSYLTQRDILHSLAPVCRDFYKMSKHHSWHTKIVINRCTNAGKAKEYIKSCRNIRELHFTLPHSKMTNDLTSCDGFIEEIKNHEFIRIIRMDPQWFITLNGYEMLLESKYSQRLCVLDATLLNTSMWKVADFPSLQELVIRSESKLHGDFISKWISKSVKLRSICVSWEPTDDNLNDLILNTKDRLETLELSSKSLSSDCLSQLSMCSQLKHLHLPFPTKVSIECLHSLAQLGNLTLLKIGSSSIESTHFITAFSPPNFGKLRTLCIKMGSFNDDCAFAIGRSCTGIQKLHISAKYLTSKGIEFLFANCQALKTFKLDSFSDEDIYLDRAFSQIWNPIPRLELFVWSGLNIRYSQFSLKLALQRSQSLMVIDNNSSLYVKESMSIGKVAHFINSLPAFNKHQLRLCDIGIC